MDFVGAMVGNELLGVLAGDVVGGGVGEELSASIGR